VEERPARKRRRRKPSGTGGSLPQEET